MSARRWPGGRARLHALRSDLEDLERISARLDWIGEDHYDGEGTELGRAIDATLEGLETIQRKLSVELELEESARLELEPRAEWAQALRRERRP